jgi:hypothetical protein
MLDNTEDVKKKYKYQLRVQLNLLEITKKIQ